MMNKMKSAKAQLIKFLFVLPLLAVLLLAFRDRYDIDITRVNPPAGSSPNTLYLVDGEIMPADFTLASIAANNLYSIRIMQDKHALQLFGKRAVNGVIAIMTKTFREKQPSLPGIKAPAFQPLFIVDSVVLSEKTMKEVDPKQIESLQVVEGEKLLLAYGEKGRNGVVVIRLK